jgi:hypothetical protein
MAGIQFLPSSIFVGETLFLNMIPINFCIGCYHYNGFVQSDH